MVINTEKRVNDIYTRLDVMNFVCSLPEDDQTSFVKTLQPRLPRPIGNRHRHDVPGNQSQDLNFGRIRPNTPIFGSFESLVTFLAPPAVTHINHLFVAPLSGTGRIRNIFALDVHDGCASRKELCLVGRAKLGLFNIAKMPHFIAIKTAKGAAR